MHGANKMEDGMQNGVHTNHERDPQMNGVNGVAADKGKGVTDAMINGGYDGAMDTDGAYRNAPGQGQAGANLHRMQDLPEEIQHITTEILPLNLILTRLAQFSHNGLQDLVSRLAAKPLPQALANGSSDYRSTNAEDASPESRDKKKDILDFVKDLHNKWVKALVITEWSKKSEEVGLLIDIRSHLITHLELYTANLSEIINVKRQLHWARVPSPDLKTALEVLDGGQVSFLPDLDYLEPPPLSTEEKIKWIDEMNTLLSVRLSLEDREKIPLPFREYTIQSGRVTFRSEGEFEIDLTIADEDFDKPLWFLDFRFLFKPAASELSDHVRSYLEGKVNEALAADGLMGCYSVLHEFVLTHKITELCRQAIELSHIKWVETLKVERLNRAMAIQYWANKTPPNGPQSWIIVGVHSGADAESAQSTEIADITSKGAWSTSYISLRWFRDGKEVHDFDIPFNVDTISAESLLRTVIARHVEHLLSTFHDKFLSKARFATRQARMHLHISKDDPADSSLTVQLLGQTELTIKVDPMTGGVLLTPISHFAQESQRKLNNTNPADEVLAASERLRWLSTMHDLHQRGQSMGWAVVRPPVKPDELKGFVQPRELYQPVFLKRSGWNPQWFIMLSLSLGGDRWWLVELGPGPANIPGHVVKMCTQLPLTWSQPTLSDEFFHNMTVFVTGLISQITDLRLLRERHIKHVSRTVTGYLSPAQIKLPIIYVRLSDILPPRAARGPRRAWSKDFVMLCFRGLHQDTIDWSQSELISFVTFARLFVTDKAKFSLLDGKVDRDVTYDPRAGQFSLRLRGEVGSSLIGPLATRLQALERMVDFLDAITRGGKGIVPRKVSLRRITFSYSYGSVPDANAGMNTTAPSSLDGPAQEARSWNVNLDLARDRDINITLEMGNPHLRVLDFLKRLANSRFEQLPTYLLRTLPLFQALDKLEDEWAKATASGLVTFDIIPKSLEWISIRYSYLVSPNLRRQLNLDIRPQERRGDVMWHVWRTDIDRNANLNANANANANSNHPGGGGVHPLSRNPNDDFSRALHQRVWGTAGPGWTGLETGAAADMDGGIVHLLGTLNTAIRSVMAQAPRPQMQQQHHHQASMTNSQGVDPSSGVSGMSGMARFTQRHAQQNAMNQGGGQGGGGGGMRPGVKSASTPATAVVLD